jgi:hypothetical protein
MSLIYGISALRRTFLPENWTMLEGGLTPTLRRATARHYGSLRHTGILVLVTPTA